MLEWLRVTAWVFGLSTALIAGALGAGGFDHATWAFLGLAVAAFGLACWLSFRFIFASLRSVNASRGTDGSRVRDMVTDSVDRQSKELSRKLAVVEKQVRSLPYVTAELGRRYIQLIKDDLPMPVLGANWSVTAQTVLFIIDEVLDNDGKRSLLECGSGASTLWAAAAFRHRGEGHVVALEHDKHFAERTRQGLRVHGLDPWATVIDAPLVKQDIPGLGTRPWYDLTGLEESYRFDLLFVDGPPGSTARLARYPALPQLLPWLSPGAIVVADDTDRAPEKRMVKMWSAPGTFERSVAVVKEVGRSTVLSVDS